MSDIAELFQRDPLKLTKPDISAIIAYYRDRRAQFNIGDKAAGATKKMTVKEPKLKSLDIDDLLNT